MWSEEVFEAVAQVSNPKAHFATFACAGNVKRSLKANGFEIEKVKGFGKKREMLRGIMQKDRPIE